MARAQFIPSRIPDKPGCYIYRDRFGTVIYVGKAANLRRRMSQYFQESRMRYADPKLRSLVHSIETWETITVHSEDEALLLESRLIKEYAPHYNILMRDDKRYLMLKIDPVESFPRLRFARLKKDDSCLYFGPFPKGGALHQTADFLVRHFGIRVCRCAEPMPEDRAHCLAGTVRDCCRPCIGEVTKEDYRKRIDALIDVLNGHIGGIAEILKQKMIDAANAQQFEKAALFRDIADNLDCLRPGLRHNLSIISLSSLSPGPEAVKELASELELPILPRNIECFDISNISGTLAVASMVHFTDGRPDKKKYRRFRIRTVTGPNDFAMMKEAVTRHFLRLIEEHKPLPELLMVDGGKGQLSSAIDALVKIHCPPLPVIGLAEKHEEVFIPGCSQSIQLPLEGNASKLLRAVRDEAHRFAITYHRSLRLNTIKNSLLDEIEGIGEVRKQALLKEFGSVRALRSATPEMISMRVKGIGLEFARTVCDYLKAHVSDGAVDPL